MSSDGIVRDPQGIAVSAAPSGQWTPSIACAAVRCVVVWEANDTVTDTNYFHQPGNIEFARVDASGTVLDPQGVMLSDADGDEDHPVVATDGTRFIVLWRSDSELNAQSLDYSGSVPTAAAHFGSADMYTVPDITSDAAGFVAVWQGRDARLRVARIASDGTASPLEGSVIGTGAANAAAPAVAFDGTGTVVTWVAEGSAGRDLFATTLGPNLSPLAADPDVLSSDSGDEAAPAISATETGQLLVVYERFVWVPDGALRVRARTIGPYQGPGEADAGSNAAGSADAANAPGAASSCGCRLAGGAGSRSAWATMLGMIMISMSLGGRRALCAKAR